MNRNQPTGCVLVTGGTGFVGSCLIERLHRSGRNVVRGTVRRQPARLPLGVEAVQVGDLGPATDWSHPLAGAGVVIHTAARVHMIREPVADALAQYRRVNVQGTLNLGRQAAAAGARRFIFLSSIKVNGEETTLGVPFKADDAPAPVDAYGISKRKAEDGLRKLASETDIEVVVIRPPLVYGPGVKATFLSMMRWLSKGIPLPLGAVRNKRSLVALDNLVDLIVTCISHPAAANQTFLVSDGEDLSTTELLSRTAMALGKPARLVPVPVPMLTAAASLLGKSEISRRLCSSLQVDISKNRELLGWVPPVSVDAALRATARHFLNESARH